MSPVAMAPRRYHEIDLLRFIAAFSVLLFHYSFRVWAADNISPLKYAWLAPVTKYGFLGVNLFFLISGFVILMTASSGSLRRFAVSRVVRLYPAYWVSCTATFVVMTLAGSLSHRYVTTPREYLVNLTMLNTFVGVPSVDTVYWSLAVEMKFYLLVAIVLAFRQIHRAPTLLGIWLALHILSTVRPVRFVSWFLIPEWAPYFIAGAVFYLIARDGVSLYKLFLLLLSYAVVTVQAIRDLANDPYHAQYSPIVMAVVLAVFYVVFFLIATGRTQRLASPRFLVLGALTYPLYLLHQNIGFTLFNWLYPRANIHVVMWGVTALMLAAAYGVNRIEKACARPFQEFLLRLTGRLAGAPSPG